MKRLTLLPLLFVSVAALDVDTLIDVLLGLATPEPTRAPTRAPTSRPYWTSATPPPTTRRPEPLTIIATAPPYTPAPVQPQPTNEQATSAPMAPPPVPPPVTPAPAPVPTTVTPPPPPPPPAATPTITPATTPTPSATPTTPPPTAPLTPPPTPPAERADSTPEPTVYVPPSIPEPSADSTTFQLVEPVACDATVINTINTIYSKNRKLFDTCAQDSAYQIFPYPGTRPTPTQIQALATSKSCASLFAACATADLPECDVTGISLKGVIETLLKITMDVEHGLASPDTERFHQMHKWRRNSNLAKAAGVPYGNDSALYAEYERELPQALEAFSVQVQDDLSIVEKNSNDGPGAVHANSGATDDGTGRGATNVTVKVLSSARSPYAVASPTIVSLAVLVVTVATMAVDRSICVSTV